jgi:signal transduction histidine kinase
MAKGLTIVWPSGSFGIYSDLDLLVQILRNLIANAIRYTDTGAINVSCIADNNELTIKIEDSGIGISAENLDSIFEEYSQIGNEERDRQKELGLGLAIVRHCSNIASR